MLWGLGGFSRHGGESHEASPFASSPDSWVFSSCWKNAFDRWGTSSFAWTQGSKYQLTIRSKNKLCKHVAYLLQSKILSCNTNGFCPARGFVKLLGTFGSHFLVQTASNSIRPSLWKTFWIVQAIIWKLFLLLLLMSTFLKTMKMAKHDFMVTMFDLTWSKEASVNLDRVIPFRFYGDGCEALRPLDKLVNHVPKLFILQYLAYIQVVVWGELREAKVWAHVTSLPSVLQESHAGHQILAALQHASATSARHSRD